MRLLYTILKLLRLMKSPMLISKDIELKNVLVLYTIYHQCYVHTPYIAQLIVLLAFGNV